VLFAIIAMVIGVAFLVGNVWGPAHRAGRRVPIWGLLTLCLLWIGLVTAIAINAVAGGVLILLAVIYMFIPGRWKHRLRGNEARRLPSEAVDALIGMYSSAMTAGSAAEHRESMEVPRALLLPDLELLQLTLLILALRQGRRRLSEREKARFVLDARAARITAAQLIDPEIAPQVMNAANSSSHSTILEVIGVGKQEYRERMMPTVIGLTAYAYSRTPGSPDRWQSRLRAAVRKYERLVGFQFGPAGVATSERG
jgi:Ca2+/Na+ antiporter